MSISIDDWWNGMPTDSPSSPSSPRGPDEPEVYARTIIDAWAMNDDLPPIESLTQAVVGSSIIVNKTFTVIMGILANPGVVAIIGGTFASITAFIYAYFNWLSKAPESVQIASFFGFLEFIRSFLASNARNAYTAVVEAFHDAAHNARDNLDTQLKLHWVDKFLGKINTLLGNIASISSGTPPPAITPPPDDEQFGPVRGNQPEPLLIGPPPDTPPPAVNIVGAYDPGAPQRIRQWWEQPHVAPVFGFGLGLAAMIGGGM